MLSDLSAMTGRAQKLTRTTRRSRIPLSHTLRTRCLASSRAGNVNVSWLAIPAGHRYRYRRVTTTTAGLQHRTVGWHRTSTVRGAVDLFFHAFLVVFTSYTSPKRHATRRSRHARGGGEGGAGDQVTESHRTHTVRTVAHSASSNLVTVDHPAARNVSTLPVLSGNFPRALSAFCVLF